MPRASLTRQFASFHSQITFVQTAIFALLVLAGSLSAQGQRNKNDNPKTATPVELKKFAYSTEAMGVSLNIVVYCDSENVEATIESAVKAVSGVNKVFSDYDPDSEVGKLNSGGDEWIDISDSFRDLFNQAKSISKNTDGQFDIALGALTHQWRAARKQKKLPASESLKKSMLVSGLSNVTERLDLATEKTQIKFPKGLRFDFGGIGKGYAADRALAAMKEKGYECALVDLGGDIAVGKAPPGKAGWKVEIAARPSSDSTGNVRYIEVSNCGIATSGDVEQFVEVDGVRYSHLLDPKTGFGLKREANVTIVAHDATTADALASAYSVMPFANAQKNRQSFKCVELLVQERIDGKVVEQKSDSFPSIQETK